MQRITTLWVTIVLGVGLSACGTNDITAPASTPTAIPSATATNKPTASATSVPTATATTVPTATVVVVAVPTATGTPTITATSSPTFTSTPVVAVALFSADASSPNNPFPSDRLLDASGHVALPPAYLTYSYPPGRKFDAARGLSTSVASQLKALEGFGTFAPLRIRFNRPMVVDTGQNPDGILLLEYDDLSARPALVRAIAYAPDASIEVYPVVPLKPKTTYALVVTTALTDVDGHHAKPSPDFVRLLAGTGLDPDLTAWRAHLQPVLTFVKSTYKIDTDGLALVEVFTTESTTDDLVTIQRRLTTGELVPGPPVFENAPLRNLETGIFPAGTQEYRDLIGTFNAPNVAAVAIGVFDAYDFRTGPKGAFDPRYVNGPDMPPMNHLDFYVTIPSAPKPAAGYPISLFGHGLGGSGRDVGQIAGVDFSPPVMGIAVSAVQHGLRGNVVNFFVLNDIATTRDNFRQTAADFLQLTKMVENAHAAGIPPFDMIDPQSIFYLGGSLGGIVGTLYMAVEPDVQVGVLSVPGGGLVNILDSIDIGGLLKPLVSVLVNLSTDDPFFPQFLRGFRQAAQWSIEPADPINYAPYIVTPGNQLPGVPPKRILMHEGITDSTVPNRTTDDLALAMRLPDLNATRGCQNAAGCSGIWRFVMTDYGKGATSGHGVTIELPQATQQAFDFLMSYGTVVNDASPSP